MEKPILRLTSKDFFTGLAMGAHRSETGLFYKAAGVTPVYNPGGSADSQNGLLQAGPSYTDVSTGLADAIIDMAIDYNSGTPNIYMLGASGHIYFRNLGNGSSTDMRPSNTLTSAHYLDIWGPAGGTVYLLYWNNGHIGTYDLSSGNNYPTGWTDSAYTATFGLKGNTHKFVGNVYFPGTNTGCDVSVLADTGSNSAAVTASCLKLDADGVITGISDDGHYLVVASARNLGVEYNGTTTIYFWDTFSPSFNISYEIKDTFIYQLKRLGNAVYAFGQHGIYEVTYAGGVKRLRSDTVGFGTLADFGNYGGRKVGVYKEAFVIATDTTIDTFGKLAPGLPAAYYKPFTLPSGRPSFTFTDGDTDRIYVGTTNNKLYAFDFNSATRQTSVSAQTAYLPLPGKFDINRIDLVFGEPLASGDSISASVYQDENTAATSFGSATFAADGAVRRKSLVPTTGVAIQDQLSLYVSFDAGNPKLKAIEVYGDPMEPTTS